MLFKHYVGLSDVKRQIIMVFLGMLLLTTTAHAADAQNTDSCYANYFAEKGELVIPCVDVIDPSGMVQSYEVTLNQLSTTDGSLQFGLKEWQVSQSDIVAIQEGSSCRAVYSVEQGNLLMPCVNVVDSNGQAEAYQVVMNQLNSNLVEVFKLGVAEANKIETNEPSTRSARAGSFGGTINLTVSGAGKVTSSAGSCRGSQKNCSWAFSSLLATLTAVPDSGKQFTGWGGVCSGTITWCMVPLVKQTKSVTATFTTLVQPCSYTISPTSANILATGQKNGLISITTTRTDCTWTASSNVSWITLSARSGKGNAQISYNVATNTDIRSRNGIITIAGKALAVTQRPVNTTMPVTLPSKPSSPSASPLSSSSVKLTWIDSSGDETGFYIYRGEGVTSTSWTKIGSVGANITSYTDNGLKANTAYSYYIASYNSAGESKSVNTSVQTQQATPTTQLNITIAGSPNGSSWVIGNQGNINCKTSCVYTISSPVTLSTAGVTFRNGGKEYELDRWEGACSGNGSCTIGPNGQNQVIYVTAKFYLARIQVKPPYNYNSYNGWLTEDETGYSNDYDILYNYVKPPVGTTIHVKVPPGLYNTKVAGWNKGEPEKCGDWSRGWGGLGSLYCYDLTKVSN